MASLSQILTVPQFDLLVTSAPGQLDQNGNLVGVTATANGIALNIVSNGGNNFFITGKANTAFAGLAMNYTYTGGALGVLGTPAGSVLGIQVYNGAASSLFSSLSAYLSPYGTLPQSINNMKDTTTTAMEKTRKIVQMRQARIDKEEARIQRLKRRQFMAKQLQKSYGVDSSRG